MKGITEPWTWREHVAHWIHQLGYRFAASEYHDVLVRDSDGVELFSVAFEGGFVASHPPKPYTIHCRHFTDDDDTEGTVVDL